MVSLDIQNWDKEHDDFVGDNKIILRWTEIIGSKEKKDPRLAGKYIWSKYYNISDGKIGYFLEDILSVDELDNNKYVLFNADWSDNNSVYPHDNYIPYVEYIRSLDLIVIAIYGIDLCPRLTTPIKPREIHEVFRLYVGRKKQMYLRKTVTKKSAFRYEPYTVPKLYEADGSHITALGKYLVKYRNSKAGQSIDGKNQAEFCRPLSNMFGSVVNFGANHFEFLGDDINKWYLFLRQKEARPKNGKNSKEIEELVRNYPLEKKNTSKRYPENVAFIEKIDDKLSVIRTMKNLDDKLSFMVDMARIYVSDKKVVACRPNNIGEWVSVPMKSLPENWRFSIYNIKNDSLSGTKLAYYSDLLKRCKPETRGSVLQSLLTYPWLEPIAKSAMKDIFEEKIKFTDKSVLEAFDNLFGGMNFKAKRLNEIVGLNAHQISMIGKYHRDSKKTNFNSGLIPYIKMIFDQDNNVTYYVSGRSVPPHPISSIDDDTFDTVFNALKELKGYESGNLFDVSRILHDMLRIYGLQTMLNNIDSVVILAKKKYHNHKDPKTGHVTMLNLSYLYHDYLLTVEKIGDTKHFKAKFNPLDGEQIINSHDAAVAVYNKDGAASSIFAAHLGPMGISSFKAKWAEWCYEEEDFCVVAPKNFGEIAMEGIELHHCAKAYIESVASGLTNVLFIRRTDDKEQPFYTVEVDNNNVLRQIAGFANYYPSGNLDILEFVERWCKEKHLIDKSQN